MKFKFKVNKENLIDLAEHLAKHPLKDGSTIISNHQDGQTIGMSASGNPIECIFLCMQLAVEVADAANIPHQTVAETLAMVMGKEVEYLDENDNVIEFDATQKGGESGGNE